MNPQIEWCLRVGVPVESLLEDYWKCMISMEEHHDHIGPDHKNYPRMESWLQELWELIESMEDYLTSLGQGYPEYRWI